MIYFYPTGFRAGERGKKRLFLLSVLLLAGLGILSCSGVYYDAMEKIGFPKRDILVDRVEAARDAQSDAQEQFKSALEQFRSVVSVPETKLSEAYDDLEADYEDSRAAARNVSDRIDRVESVSGALFKEWEAELDLYENPELRRISARKLRETKTRYEKMLVSMHRAEKSMAPVLEKFEDNVLFLKHNLNAQAIGSLKGEFSTLEADIDGLIEQMNRSIQASDVFIADLRKAE